MSYYYGAVRFCRARLAFWKTTHARERATACVCLRWRAPENERCGKRASCTTGSDSKRSATRTAVRRYRRPTARRSRRDGTSFSRTPTSHDRCPGGRGSPTAGYGRQKGTTRDRSHVHTSNSPHAHKDLVPGPADRL